MQSTLRFPTTLEQLHVLAEATSYVEDRARLRLLEPAESRPLGPSAIAAVAPALSPAACRLVIESLVHEGLLTSAGALTPAGQKALRTRRVPRRETGAYKVLIVRGDALPAAGLPCAIDRAPEVHGVRLERLKAVAPLDASAPDLEGHVLSLPGGAPLRVDRLLRDPSGNVATLRAPGDKSLTAIRVRDLDLKTLTNTHTLELTFSKEGSPQVLKIPLPPLSEGEMRALLTGQGTQIHALNAPAGAPPSYTWDVERGWLGAARPPAGANPSGPFDASVKLSCTIPGETGSADLSLTDVPVGPRDTAAAETWLSVLLARRLAAEPTFLSEPRAEALHSEVASAVPGGVRASQAALDGRLAQWSRGEEGERHLAFRMSAIHDFSDLSNLFA